MLIATQAMLSIGPSYDADCERFARALTVALTSDFTSEAPPAPSELSVQVARIRADLKVWLDDPVRHGRGHGRGHRQSINGLLRQLRETCRGPDGTLEQSRISTLQRVFQRAQDRLDEAQRAARCIVDHERAQQAVDAARRGFANTIVFVCKLASSIFRWAGDTTVPDDIRSAIEQHGFELVTRIAHATLTPEMEALITLMGELVQAIPGMDARSPELFRWTQTALEIATSPMCRYFEDDPRMRQLLARANLANNAEITTNVYRDDPADDGVSQALMAASIRAIHGARAAREILAALEGVACPEDDVDIDPELIALYARLGEVQRRYSEDVLRGAFSRRTLDYFEDKIAAARMDVGRSMTFAFLLNRAPDMVLAWARDPGTMRRLFGRERAEDVECANADRIFFELVWQMCLFEHIGEDAYQALMSHPGVEAQLDRLFVLLERSQQVGNALGTLRREIFVGDLGNFVAYRIGNDCVNEILSRYPARRRRRVLWSRLKARLTPAMRSACRPLFDEIFPPRAQLPEMPLISLYRAAQHAFDSDDPARGYRISQMIWALIELVNARGQAFARWKRNEEEIQETIAALHASGASAEVLRGQGAGARPVPVSFSDLLPAAAVARSNRLLLIMHCMLDREPRYFNALRERW